MDEEDIQPQSQISLAMGFLGLFVTVVMSLLGFIPFAGDVEDLPAGIGLIVGAVFKVPTPIILTGGLVVILEAIPIVQEVPWWVIAWLLIWYALSHPTSILGKLIVTTAEVGTMAEGAEGGAAGAEGALKAEGAAASAVEGEAAAAGAIEGGAASAEAEGRALESEAGEGRSAEENPTEANRPGQQGGEGEEGGGRGEGGENEKGLPGLEGEQPIEEFEKETMNPSEDFGSWDNAPSVGGDQQDEEDEDEKQGSSRRDNVVEMKPRKAGAQSAGDSVMGDIDERPRKAA